MPGFALGSTRSCSVTWDKIFYWLRLLLYLEIDNDDDDDDNNGDNNNDNDNDIPKFISTFNTVLGR